mmetsp:Transcript_45645/g.111126  ORF Transcript_45645/g.111126 Transcript_45645/m.111126 type:complete len:255 (-) Transcript_45645:1111-1875(-)
MVPGGCFLHVFLHFLSRSAPLRGVCEPWGGEPARSWPRGAAPWADRQQQADPGVRLCRGLQRRRFRDVCVQDQGDGHPGGRERAARLLPGERGAVAAAEALVRRDQHQGDPQAGGEGVHGEEAPLHRDPPAAAVGRRRGGRGEEAPDGEQDHLRGGLPQARGGPVLPPGARRAVAGRRGGAPASLQGGRHPLARGVRVHQLQHLPLPAGGRRLHPQRQRRRGPHHPRQRPGAAPRRPPGGAQRGGCDRDPRHER